MITKQGGNDMLVLASAFANLHKTNRARQPRSWQYSAALEANHQLVGHMFRIPAK
jgi:hypothetical protein